MMIFRSLLLFSATFVFVKCEWNVIKMENNRNILKIKNNSKNKEVEDVDPQVWMNISEVIRSYGYPCEDHEVITEDGYILSLQRIPHGIKKDSEGSPNKVVLLQHGLLDSTHTWVNNLPGESLGFILADAGFDVWMVNSRGNLYSNKHTKLNPKDKKFWEFSWDQMGRYDLPASVTYVLKTNGVAKKLAYVGHSQGTMIAFAGFPLNPLLSEQIAVFVAFAPVAYLGHVEAGLRILAHFKAEIKFILRVFGHGSILPSSKIMRTITALLCGPEGFPQLCEDAYFLLIGGDTTNFNRSRLPIYFSHNPAGTSLMNLLHYAQAVDNDLFQMFDYNSEGNMAHYNQTTPPQYSFAKYNVPTVIFSGGNDSLANPTDVDRLIPLLGSNVKFSKRIPIYNHMDFVQAINAYTMLYPQVIQIINQYLSK